MILQPAPMPIGGSPLQTAGSPLTHRTTEKQKPTKQLADELEPGTTDGAAAGGVTNQGFWKWK